VDPESGINIPDPQHCLLYSTVQYIYILYFPGVKCCLEREPSGQRQQSLPALRLLPLRSSRNATAGRSADQTAGSTGGIHSGLTSFSDTVRTGTGTPYPPFLVTFFMIYPGSDICSGYGLASGIWIKQRYDPKAAPLLIRFYTPIFLPRILYEPYS
jgi:hypothetical protein